MNKALGRYAAADERDKNYLLRAATGTPSLASLPRTKYRHSPYCIDQNGIPKCTGSSAKTMLINGPHMQGTPLTFPMDDDLYNYAQKNDEWPGEDYGGSSVRAAMKACVYYGQAVEYRWAFTIDDMVRWIALYGRLVMGTDWTSNMSEPHIGKDGRAWITPDGEYEGGHAFGVDGYNLDYQFFRMENNWGREYGDNGFARISFDAVAYLLERDAEAACPLERKVVI